MKLNVEQGKSQPYKLLFLCTGNYYRSRFAEALFNVLARENSLEWVACSRGIATDLGIHNEGPISIYALRGLEARGISLGESIRYPMQLEEEDLGRADLIVALKEEEHRKLLGERFPRWVERVKYWQVGDLGETIAEEALAEIEREVRRLIRQMNDLFPGLAAEVEAIVAEADTADRLGSGSISVLGTPALVGLMEGAAVQALVGRLPPGQTSVGGRIDARHLAPTPVGMRIRAQAKLVEVQGRRLRFHIEVWDEVEQIGEATHERFVVDEAGFVAQAEAKGK